MLTANPCIISFPCPTSDFGLPPFRMPTIAITGGVASGKSTFTRALQALLGAETFDTDAAARQLLEADADALAAVRVAFGPGVFDAAGHGVDRAALRAAVFADPAARRELEAILHPRVRARWRGWLEERLQSSPDAILLVEIPLLYETGAAEFFDVAIVVGCSLETQMRRLTGPRGLSEEMARQIIASQWKLAEKIRLCDHLIWNDGSAERLHTQADLCARYLQSKKQP